MLQIWNIWSTNFLPVPVPSHLRSNTSIFMITILMLYTLCVSLCIVSAGVFVLSKCISLGYNLRAFMKVLNYDGFISTLYIRNNVWQFAHTFHLHQMNVNIRRTLKAAACCGVPGGRERKSPSLVHIWSLERAFDKICCYCCFKCSVSKDFNWNFVSSIYTWRDSLGCHLCHALERIWWQDNFIYGCLFWHKVMQFMINFFFAKTNKKFNINFMNVKI